MQIIENPSNKQLAELRAILRSEKNVGIVDIFDEFSSLYLAAKDEGFIVGVASIREMEESAELYKLYVSPSYRRRGVGRILFERTLDALAARNIKELFIEAAGESRLFWGNVTSTHRTHWYTADKLGVIVGDQQVANA